jgi:hypothetical protein
MHVEKGVFKSTIGLLLDIPSKTKDGLSTRKDIQTLEIREELHPQERPNGKVYLPPVSYTLTTEEKRVICKCLRGIRAPAGFSWNINNLVSMSDLRMSGYDMHDCNTMLLLFLVIAIRAINHPYVKIVITCMCHFFSVISKKVIDVIEWDELCKEIGVTMCQLEMCFPPSYVHALYLSVWTSYVVIKGYVHNHGHTKQSLIKGYTTEEIIECYVDYIKDRKPIGVPVWRHHGRLSGKGTKGGMSFTDATYKRVHEAHFSII